MHDISLLYIIFHIFRKSLVLQQAYEISISYLLGNWIRALKLVRKITSPVLLCAMHRHFPLIHRYRKVVLEIKLKRELG